MSKHKRRQPMGRQKNTESVAESISHFIQQVIDLCVCAGILLLLAVLPFYNQEGFKHIGTDKATFFKYFILYGRMLILPLLVIAIILQLVVWIQKNGMPDWKAWKLKNFPAFCKRHLSVTDCFAICYGVALLLSYVCSNYKADALWGATGWFMGLVPQLTLVFIYFLVSRMWKARKWMAALVLPVSAVVFVLGYLNRFGIYPIDMQLEHIHFISTIGNINWYCGYMMTVFWGGMFLLLQVNWEKWWQKLLLVLYVVIGFATLVTQGSASGIFTMAVMFLVFFAMCAGDGRRMEAFWLTMVLFSAVCAVNCVIHSTKLLTLAYQDPIILLFIGKWFSVIVTIVSVAFYIWVYRSNRRGQYPVKLFVPLSRLAWGGAAVLLAAFVILMIVNTVSGGCLTGVLGETLSSIFLFTPGWGSNRGATWTAGWLCFLEQDIVHKLMGAGPDSMAAFIYNEGSGELVNLVKTQFDSARLTNAHNEWLTILVNLGLLGFVSYVGMMISAIRRFLQNRTTNIIAAACGICLLAYTVNNMFSFQQTMNVTTAFVILGMGENFKRKCH